VKGRFEHEAGGEGSSPAQGRVYSIVEVYPVGKAFAHAEEFLDSLRIVPVGTK
jgi:hypothetical protein